VLRLQGAQLSLAPDWAQGDFEAAFTVPLETMPLNGVGHCFTVVSRELGAIATGKLVNILKFKVSGRPEAACRRTQAAGCVPCVRTSIAV
jgi:hypothetical protein